MYFLQQAGENMRLNYTKGRYGPYSANLRHQLQAIEGHLLFGYADGGDAPDKRLQLVPGALDDAIAFLGNKPDTQEHIKRVSDLVKGFESPFGLELLSTVHWTTSQEKVPTFEELVARIYAWNDRKRQFSRRQIALAVEVLARKNWIVDSGIVEQARNATTISSDPPAPSCS